MASCNSAVSRRSAIRSHPERLTGRTTKLEDVTDAISALGSKLPGEWSVQGPASFDLMWNSPAGTQPAQLFGEIGLESDEVRAPFLNHPISQVHGTLNLIGSAEELTISSAEAFGGQWSGTLTLSPLAGDTRFSLRADRLNAEDLDRWLNPRWRQGFLEACCRSSARTARKKFLPLCVLPDA